MVEINPETTEIRVDWGKLEKIYLYLDKSNKNADSNSYLIEFQWVTK